MSAQRRVKSAPQNKPKTKEELDRKRARRGDDASNPRRRHDYDLHRERVNSVKAMVDSSSPIVVRNTYTSPANFNRSIKNFVNIERENARMLGRIAQIMKDPATVDNRLGMPIDKMNARNHYREKAFLKLAFENMEMYNRIKATKPVYSRQKQLKDYAKAEKVMELTSYYPLFWKANPSGPLEDHRSIAMANAQSNPKPTVFLELETDEESLGQIVIELRADVVPLTAENFRCLCTGEMGLSYKCSEIHRIVPEILWQGGDVTGKDGRGGKSIYGDSFPDENFKLKHDEKGVVSMCNSGKDSGGSQFMIIAKKISALDGVNVVVGKVTSGIDILDKLSDNVSSSGTMKKKIWISKCGSSDGGGGGDEGDEDEDEDEQKPVDEDGNSNEAYEDKTPQSAIEENPGSAIDKPSDWNDDKPPSVIESEPEEPKPATQPAPANEEE